MPNRDMPLDFYRAAFEHAMHAVIAIDDDRHVVAANGAAAELFKTPLDSLLGRSLDTFAHADNAELNERLWGILLSGGTFRHEIEIVAGDGQRRRIRIAGKGDVEPGLHLAILGDVTRSTEHELSSRRYELLRERAQDVILFIARDGRIVEANHAAEATYGYSREELLTLHIRDLRHDMSNFELMFRTAMRDGAVFETVHKRKDGTAFPVEVASRPSMVGDDVLLSVIRDITERRALQAKLLEADRLSTFGLVAAGVAHEVNNPLAYALTNHELIAKELPRLVALTRASEAGDGQHLRRSSMASTVAAQCSVSRWRAWNACDRSFGTSTPSRVSIRSRRTSSTCTTSSTPRSTSPRASCDTMHASFAPTARSRRYAGARRASVRCS